MRGAVVVHRPATVDVIEIPPVAWVDELPASRALNIPALDLPRPLLAQAAMSSPVLAVMLRVDRLGLAMTEAEAVTARLRDEVRLAVRFGALSVGAARHRTSGREIPGRGSQTRTWLLTDAPDVVRDAVLLATHETAANAMRHGEPESPVSISANQDEAGGFTIEVITHGAWKEPEPGHNGRALALMTELMAEGRDSHARSYA